MFSNPNCNILYVHVIATTTFGIGVDIVDIRQVIHWSFFYLRCHQTFSPHVRVWPASCIAPATIRTYLVALCHTQIMRGHPEPRESSSLPRLRLVQNGVRRERAHLGPFPQARLPLTPPILGRIRPSSQSASWGYDGFLYLHPTLKIQERSQEQLLAS